MATQGMLENLTPAQIRFLDDEDLREPAVLDRLWEMCNDEQFEAEPGAARDFYETLEKSVTMFESALQSHPQAYARIHAVLLVLFWKSLLVMPEKVAIETVGTSTLTSVKLGVRVTECLDKWLDVYESNFVPQKDLRRSLALALESNQEVLGEKSLVQDGRKVPPTVQNWLKDYNSVEKIRQGRGKFERISYINKSENARTLSAEEKRYLGEILSAYDWALFPPPPAVEVIDEKTGPYTNTVSASFPAPVLPQFKHAALPESAPGKPNPPSPAARLSLSDKPAPPAASQPKSPAVDIDKKLNELRKKIK